MFTHVYNQYSPVVAVVGMQQCVDSLRVSISTSWLAAGTHTAGGRKRSATSLNNNFDGGATAYLLSATTTAEHDRVRVKMVSNLVLWSLCVFILRIIQSFKNDFIHFAIELTTCEVWKHEQQLIKVIKHEGVQLLSDLLNPHTSVSCFQNK
ncbi:hypothetical protein ACJX0J_007630 [Zea mays]